MPVFISIKNKLMAALKRTKIFNTEMANAERHY